MPTKYILLAAIFACLSLGSGCGSDDGPGGNNGITPGNNHSNDSGADAGTDASDVDVPDGTSTPDGESPPDADAQPDAEDGVSDITDTSDGEDDDATDSDTDDDPDTNTETCQEECAPGFSCVESQCVEDSAELKCGAAQDLGELTLGTTTTVTGTLRGATDVLPTACGPASEDEGIGGEAIFTFTVAETMQIDFDATWSGQYDGVIAFRTDSCTVPGSAMDPCFDREEESFRAEAGHTYYMIVELAVGRGNNFSIDLTTTEAGCIPGTESCTGDVLTRCVGAGIAENHACADVCSASGERCRGTTCDEAITVTASTTFSGNNAAHTNVYNFQDFPGCEVDDTLVSTPGQEVVFFLPGLTAGQVVTIDTATGDTNNNAVFITSNCSKTTLSCVATDYINEGLTWTVPSDGGYYIFIDKASSTGDAFQYSIDIQ